MICPKCGSKMLLDDEPLVDTEGMSEGQEADYWAGFGGNFVCSKCNYSEWSADAEVGCRDIVDTDYSTEAFSEEIKPDIPKLTRKINETTRISENKVNRIKEEMNEYLATKRLEEEGWETYRTVNVSESHLCKGSYIHEVNPLLLEAIKQIKKKTSVKNIFKDVLGLPDLTAINKTKKQIRFIELKGFKFPNPTEVQEKKFGKIKKAGFPVEIQRRKFKIDIFLEEEKSENA